MSHSQDVPPHLRLTPATRSTAASAVDAHALVLLVTDQEWTARSIESTLGPAGFTVLKAYTGKLGLELVASRRPGAIIVDRRLPEGLGVDFVRRLQEAPSFDVSTVVFIRSPGPVERQERLEALAACAWDVLQAPLDSEELTLKLRTYLRARQELDELRGGAPVDGPAAAPP